MEEKKDVTSSESFSQKDIFGNQKTGQKQKETKVIDPSLIGDKSLLDQAMAHFKNVYFPNIVQFFGDIELKYTLNTRCGTAATDGKKVYIDPFFFASLSLEERVFLIAHEIMHVYYMHVERQKIFMKKHPDFDPLVWNIATDAIINANLEKSGLKIRDGYINIPEAAGYTPVQVYNILIEKREEYREKMRQEKLKQKQENGDNESQDSGDQSQQKETSSGKQNGGSNSADDGSKDESGSHKENGGSDKDQSSENDKQSNNGKQGEGQEEKDSESGAGEEQKSKQGKPSTFDNFDWSYFEKNDSNEYKPSNHTGWDENNNFEEDEEENEEPGRRGDPAPTPSKDQNDDENKGGESDKRSDSAHAPSKDQNDDNNGESQRPDDGSDQGYKKPSEISDDDTYDETHRRFNEPGAFEKQREILRRQKEEAEAEERARKESENAKKSDADASNDILESFKGSSRGAIPWSHFLKRALKKKTKVLSDRREEGTDRWESIKVNTEYRVEVMIDVSGSVLSQIDMLKAFLRELKTVASRSNVKLYIGFFNAFLYDFYKDEKGNEKIRAIYYKELENFDIKGTLFKEYSFDEIDHFKFPINNFNDGRYTQIWDLAARAFTDTRLDLEQRKIRESAKNGKKYQPPEQYRKLKHKYNKGVNVQKFVFTDGYGPKSIYPKEELKNTLADDTVWLVYADNGEKTFTPCCGERYYIPKSMIDDYVKKGKKIGNPSESGEDE